MIRRRDVCPHPGCTVVKPRSHYACVRHWRQLPTTTKAAIYSAHRARNLTDWLKADAKAKDQWLNNRDFDERDF